MNDNYDDNMGSQECPICLMIKPITHYRINNEVCLECICLVNERKIKYKNKGKSIYNNNTKQCFECKEFKNLDEYDIAKKTGNLAFKCRICKQIADDLANAGHLKKKISRQFYSSSFN